jgi:hypothetical protein
MPISGQFLGATVHLTLCCGWRMGPPNANVRFPPVHDILAANVRFRPIADIWSDRKIGR